MNKISNKFLQNPWRMVGFTIVPLVILLVWHVIAVRVDKFWLFPPVTHVVEQIMHPLRDHYSSGSLLSNTLVSLLRVGIGFVLASMIGVLLGLLMGSIRVIRGLLEPAIELLRPLCPIAWLPFAIAVFKVKTVPQLFGVDYSHTILDQAQLGMIFVIFVGGFFPVLINTIDGVTSVRHNYILLSQVLGASRHQRFRYVYLPAAMPMIMTGLRQGIGLCWFVIIAAEFLPGAGNGIGYLLMYAADNAAMDIVIACMIIIGLIGATLNFIMVGIMKRFVKWKSKEI